MQKFHPILFSTEMVKAIQEGRKTQTRRTKGLDEINKYPDKWLVHTNVFKESVHDRYAALFLNTETKEQRIINLPYGYVGDVVWVRETTTVESMTDKAPFHTIYKADVGERYPMGSNKWKPSIFMPKSACRIFLEITDIKIERLQDISEEDAIKEGVEYRISATVGPNLQPGYRKYRKGWHPDIGSYIYAKESFRSLWQLINGLASWEANPFIWAISFKRITKPENFK